MTLPLEGTFTLLAKWNITFYVYLLGCISTAGGTQPEVEAGWSVGKLYVFGCAAPLRCVGRAPAGRGERLYHPPNNVLATDLLKALCCQTCALTRDMLALQRQPGSLIFPSLLPDSGAGTALQGKPVVSFEHRPGGEKAKKALCWQPTPSACRTALFARLTPS